MGKVRRRRLIVGILTVALSGAAACWYFLPQLLERGVPLVAARFGVRSDSLVVTAASPWSVSLGPLRQCYRSRASTLCVIAASAELRFSWSIASRTARVDLIRLQDAVVEVVPNATVAPEAPTTGASVALPDAFPAIHVEFVRGGNPLPLETAGSRYGVEGELRVSAAEAKFALTVTRPQQTVIKAAGLIVLGERLLRLNDGALEVAGERLTVEGVAHVEDALQFDVTLRHPRSTIYGTVSGTAEAGGNSGSLKIDAAIEKLPLDGTLLPLPAVHALQLHSGGLAAKGSFAWGPSAGAPEALIIAKELSGSFGACSFEKLSGALAPLAGTLSAATLASLQCGIELRELKGDIGVHYVGAQSILRGRRIEAALLGGWAGIAELSLGKEFRSSPIELRGISLAQLVSLHKQEYIEAEGSIDATIPISRSAEGFAVVGGTVSSSGEGWIKYHGSPLANESEQSVLGVTQRALREYRFTAIEAQIRYAADGALGIAAQLKGNSPALNTDRPVHVNLALEENLLELFKSLQIANDIEQQLHNLR